MPAPVTRRSPHALKPHAKPLHDKAALTLHPDHPSAENHPGQSGADTDPTLGPASVFPGVVLDGLTAELELRKADPRAPEQGSPLVSSWGAGPGQVWSA